MPNELKDSLTLHQLLTLSAFMLPNLLESMSFSMIEPFFPVEAQRKGVNFWTIGVIFATFSIVEFICCMLWGKYLPEIGAKRMYVVGLSTTGILIQIFGILIRLSNTTAFIIGCFFSRSITAIGSAARKTSLFAICAHTFPGRVAVTIAISEVLQGVGFAMGPAVGGILYEIGGYEFPFLVLGVGVTISSIIGAFLLPKQIEIQETSGSLTRFLSIWQAWPIMFAVLLDSTWFAFFDPTLAIHLQQFNLSPSHVGIFYFCASAVYATFTPLTGYFVDKTGLARPFIIIGFVVSGVGYLLVGPSPITHIPSKLWIVGIGMCTIELGWSFSLVTTYQDMLASSERYGLESGIFTCSVVSGIYNGVVCLGNTLGPSLSIVMVEHLGFSGSCTIMSLSAFILAISLGMFSLFELRLSNGSNTTRKYELLDMD